MANRPVIASQLDVTVTLQIMGKTRSSTSGAAVPTVQTTINNVPAQNLPMRGSEVLRGGELMSMFDNRFLMRWRSDLSAKDRIVYDGVTYDIYSVAEIGRREGLEVLAKARRV